MFTMIRLLEMEVFFLCPVFVITEAAGLLDNQCDSGSKVEEPVKMRTEFFCRVCACTSEELVPVFGEQGLELQLLEKIHIHLPIMVMTCNDLILFCGSCG
jgi:hypothetical protein